MEHGDRVFVVAGDEDVVVGDGDRARSGDPFDTVDAVGHGLQERQPTGPRIAAEDRHRVVEPAGHQHPVARRVERYGAGPGYAVDAVGAVAVDRDEGKRAGRGVALESGHGVLRAPRHVDVRAVGAHRDRRSAVEPVDAAEAVGDLGGPGDGAAHGVAGEDRHRVVDLGGHVDVLAVGAHGDGRRAVEPVGAAEAVELGLDEGQVVGGGVAAEDRESVVDARGDEDLLVVGAHRDMGGTIEPDDAADVVFLDRCGHEVQVFDGGVAAEDGERIVDFRGDVDVATVGAHGDSRGAEEAEDAVHLVFVDLDEAQGAERGVAVEDGESVVVASRGVDLQPVSAGFDAHHAPQTVDALVVAKHLDEREQSPHRRCREQQEKQRETEPVDDGQRGPRGLDRVGGISRHDENPMGAVQDTTKEHTWRS